MAEVGKYKIVGGKLIERHGEKVVRDRDEVKPARKKNRDHDDGDRKPRAKAEADLPFFDTAELDAKLAQIQRSDYAVAITSVNGSLFDATKAAETTKLQMATYDAASTDDKFDLYNQAQDMFYASAGKDGYAMVLPPKEEQLAPAAPAAPSPLLASYNSGEAPAIATEPLFDVEQAIAKAEIKPAPQPQVPAQPEPKAPEVDAEAKIEKMFAQFNGKEGPTIYVYKRSEKLSPKDKAAATLVQEAYNLIGIGNFSESEIGHVAGGKTAKITKRYNGVDGVVGEKTYAMLERDVEKAIAQHPEKAKEFLARVERIQENYMADLVKESKQGLVQNSATELPIPQNQADRGVGA